MSADLDEMRLEMALEEREASDPLHEEFEAELGKLVRVQTRCVTIHTQLPPAEAQRVGLVVETLALHLQKRCQSMAITPTRASNYDSLSLIGVAPYHRFLDFWGTKNPELTKGRSWPLLPELAGGSRGRLSFFREIPEHRRHPVHWTVFQFGRFIVDDISDFEAPKWVSQGFAAYCEYIALRENRCRSIDYENKDLNLKGNWLLNAKKLKLADRLTDFHMLNRMELNAFTPPDYLSAYAGVYFLMETNPEGFVDYLQDLKSGANRNEALESYTGKTIEALTKERDRWLASRRR